MSVDVLSVYSVVYIDHSPEVADAVAVFHRADVQHSISVKNLLTSKQFEIYPGRYVCMKLDSSLPGVINIC